MAGTPSDLASFVEATCGNGALRVEENLGAGYVRLRVAEAERRQAKHDIRCIEDVVIEMLRNARDAGARHIYVASSREGDTRTIVMLDDGSGIPANMHDRIFEARVTSKLESVHVDRWGVHGRGMALFSVRENVESARVVSSAPGKGAAIKVVSNASVLPERADQSTWPLVSRDEDGREACVRGPHNIIRTCAEFALEERGSCEVYLGSAAEIAATAHARAPRAHSDTDLLFIDDLSELPVLTRLREAADASELLEQALSLGLEMSERTAHRIISGQVKPLRSVAAQLLSAAPKNQHEVDLMSTNRGLKMSKSDKESFALEMERAISFVTSRYYDRLTDDPKVRVSSNKITVTFEVEDSD